MEKNVSFSNTLKRELSSVKNTCRNCKVYELYAMIEYGRNMDEFNISVTTEHKSVVDRFVSDIIDLTGAIVTVSYSSSRYRKGVKLYTAVVEDKVDCETIRSILPYDIDNVPDCCLSAYIRGAFLVCGSISDPHKEYHFEFSIPKKRRYGHLLKAVEAHDIKLKKTIRKDNIVLYVKTSESIEDLLTVMGATHSSLEIMNIKIYKDICNKVNRQANCEMANIGKTVAAAHSQINDIKYISDKIGLSSLPDELKEIAEIRIQNPDMSLRELGMELSVPITRSGVNHRLKKISQIAEDLRNNNKNK